MKITEHYFCLFIFFLVVSSFIFSKLKIISNKLQFFCIAFNLGGKHHYRQW